ncbi:MAG: cyclic nucleotide-binding domain-containing protein [Treponema sp.]|nr:cyclic nucleotide-binding domain-containing protein [Treponema sp.]
MLETRDLRKYSLFGGLTDAQMAEILPMMEQEEYEAGAAIITEGTPNDKIYFILRGRVAVTREGIILTEFGEGEVFGEMEVLEIMPSAATITALSPVTVMVIANKTLRKINLSDPKTFSLMVMNLARDLSRRLRRMNDQVVGKLDFPEMHY